jgi:hypothetical protein
MRRSSKPGKAGKLKYIGFTGHKDPRIHLYMLEVAERNGFRFDAVQMPLNVMDAHYRSFEKRSATRIGQEQDRRSRNEEYGQRYSAEVENCQTDRVPALRIESSYLVRDHWYRQHAVLDQAFEAVRTFHPLSAEEIRALLAKTLTAAAKGEFEPFKTTSMFDGTAQNPDWLGEESPKVKALMGET